MGIVGVALAISVEAQAFPQDHLAKARVALKEEDKRAARQALDLAHDAFGSSEGVAPNDILATYWFYKGLWFNQKNRSDSAMNAFRQALVVDRQFSWDREVNDDRELRKVFEALRGEVGSRDTISPGLPDKLGCAQVYVDGSRVSGDQEVAIGQRLAQVQCPHGDVYGVWTDFNPESPVDWLALCPYPVDTTIELVEASAPASEFEGMDVEFGESQPEESNPCLEIMAKPPPVVATANTPSSGTRDTSKSNYMKSTFGLESWTLPRIITVGAGGALITSGIAVHFGGVVPAYDMVEWGRRNPTGLTRYQADILTDRFKTRRTISYALTATGVAATVVGVFVLKPKTTGIQPTLLPHGMGLYGRF